MIKKKDRESKIKKIIKRLKEYDQAKEVDDEVKIKMMETIIAIGKTSIPVLIDLLNEHEAWMSNSFAADVLGEIGDERAIEPLANALEHPELGESAHKALMKFGSACILEVIKKIEYRIDYPIKTGRSIDMITSYALIVIGEIQCDQSSNFLKNLLDNYMSVIPGESFDPTKYDWKYRNVDFFHLLDCMVKQQDKSAIPHIKKARDFFPKHYTDYIICQIAMGRIKKGKVEGYLPMEALDISMPSGRIMDALNGEQSNWKDTFDEEYGEYFDEDY